MKPVVYFGVIGPSAVVAAVALVALGVAGQRGFNHWVGYSVFPPFLTMAGVALAFVVPFAVASFAPTGQEQEVRK